MSGKSLKDGASAASGTALSSQAIEPASGLAPDGLQSHDAWHPIGTAPELERVWVCGIQRQNGGTRAYWWWHEDCVYRGKAIEYPDATHWARINLPTHFPHAAEAV